jgi:hypothetical protein
MTDEAVAVERAGKIRTISPITRFKHIEDSGDTARLAGMSQLDLDSFKERFFFE